MELISLVALIFLALLFSYLVLLAMASIKGSKRPLDNNDPITRFVVAIPAHNEANVIQETAQRLQQLFYPKEMFRIYVVADHCNDNTAEIGRKAGAIVYERREGHQSSKGAALSWLLLRICEENWCDAVVVFDADTLVDKSFLRIMDAHITKGERVIQGRHIISNPNDGWFPALTWAMFIIDNRFQNLGRSNLGWSAKHMGDSICFHLDVLKTFGCGEGLTEDYHLRFQLLMEDIMIVYEPEAIGYGEAPLTWKQAQTQRARWLRGAKDARKQFNKKLFTEALKRGKVALFDGWLQTIIPPYSTLAAICVLLFFFQVAINLFVYPAFSMGLLLGWCLLLGFMIVYPLFGLALERTPTKAYIAILLGPVFIVWRTWLAIMVRFRKMIPWIRTQHKGSKNE